MTCATCQDTGFYPFVDAENTAPAEAITVADLHFAVCLCEVGQSLRRGENNGRRTVSLWRVWCAREQVDPSRVFLLEEVFSAEELAAAGLRRVAAPLSREAALLAAGRGKGGKR